MSKQILFSFFIVFFISLFSLNKLNAQASNNQVPWTDTTRVEYNRWYVGGMFGVYQFYGDISENNFFTGGAEYGFFNWTFGLRAGREFNSNFGSRVVFNMGSISSSKHDIWFNADVRNAGLDFTMNLTNIIAPYKYNKKWNVTVFIGAGFMGYRSILYDGLANDSILNTVGYDKDGNKESLILKSYFNMGVDVAYRIGDHFDIFLDVGFNSTPVDDLDSKPVTLSELDNYSNVSLGLHYTFGKHEEAYKWNPKSDYIKAIEDKIVDMGNNVESAQNCCAEKNMINPCDTSTVDGDKDMVPDCRDLELDSPEGSLVNWQGIAIISPDSTTGEQQVRGGIAETPRRSSAPSIFFSPVYFEYDKTVIDSTGEFSIVNVALYMKQYPDTRILISGNTDKHASDEYNDDLSLRRCNKVRQILVDEYSIEVGRLEVKAKGKHFLLFPKKDHINRRVDFSVID